MNESRAWGWFLAWSAVGAGFVAGLLAAFALPVTLVLWVASGAGAAVLAKHKEAREAWPGIVAGVSILVFLIAYLNRRGPGNVCTAHIGLACTSSEQRWSPLPFLAVGLLMVVGGVGGFIFMRRQAHK
jgi:ABC-type spermidine/putrescine transport system permease subunit II